VEYDVYKYDGGWKKQENTATKYITELAPLPEHIYSTPPTKNLNQDVTYLIGPNATGAYQYYSYDTTLKKWTYGAMVENIFLPLLNASIYKPGYHCYYKQIGRDKTNNNININDTIFPYHVSDYYR
jgi:hypothetical protein